MAKIIGITQVKGGAGRSTIATNLAGSTGGRVALIDCDMPQGTSASWYAIRQQQDSLIKTLTLATANNHKELIEQAKQLTQSHDLIVIDCPPRIAEITRAVLIISDLCLIPLGASAAEIWATSDLLKTIEEAKEVKPGVDARIVWNRYRGVTKSAQELSAAVKEQLGLPEMQTKLGLRVAYSDALASGLTAMEWPDKAARDEVLALITETIQILSK
jgi:chromosome partitioning protein